MLQVEFAPSWAPFALLSGVRLIYYQPVQRPQTKSSSKLPMASFNRPRLPTLLLSDTQTSRPLGCLATARHDSQTATQQPATLPKLSFSVSTCGAAAAEASRFGCACALTIVSEFFLAPYFSASLSNGNVLMFCNLLCETAAQFNVSSTVLALECALSYHLFWQQ